MPQPLQTKVPQNPTDIKQQKGEFHDAPQQQVLPETPPPAHIQPEVLPHKSLARSHTRQEPSEQPANANPEPGPLHATPGRPKITEHGFTAIVFLV
jgi:hypothetical protein